jgi:AraC-like DNA-binding protein
MAKVDITTHQMHEMSASRADLEGPMEFEERERLVLVLDAPVTRALKSARASEYRTRSVATWDALEDAVATAAPSTVALVDPYSGRKPGEPPSPRLFQLIAQRPSIPFIVAVDLDSTPVEDIVMLLEGGVAEVLDLDFENTPGAVVGRLRGSHARPLKRRVEDILSPYASADAASIVRAACEVAVDRGGAGDLAKRFGVEPRTVSGWCRREALPPPRRLQAWARVMLAGMLLEEEGRPIMNAARAAGYANDHALRRALRDLMGADNAALERGAIFQTASEIFNAELRDLREAVRERRRAHRIGLERL